MLIVLPFGGVRVTVEIVLLAMVALFVGLRLYAVLGRRTGHEQQPVTRPEAVPGTETPAPVADLAQDRSEGAGFVYEDKAANGVRAIVSADPSFDVARFLEGAQGAYRMILEAFWKGDRTELTIWSATKCGQASTKPSLPAKPPATVSTTADRHRARGHRGCGAS
jgi:predicted lipid-binding transport protein (Tim44 family)